jgi:dihydroneopterin aldolase
MPCRIETNWELQLFVGCTEAERSSEQPVAFALRITSPNGFRAGWSDALADTLDVDSLRNLISTTARAARVATLERLGLLLETALREAFPEPGLEWELSLCKQKAGWTYVQTWTS